MITLEISLNQDLDILVTWFSQNYLIVNSIKTQGMLLCSHTRVPGFFIGNTKVALADYLKIIGVTIKNKLTYCKHISNMLKKRIPITLQGLPASSLDYCSPLLIRINKTFNF